MLATQLYKRLRARVAAGVGQLRDIILPRHAVPAGAARRMSAPRSRRREPAAPPR